ncbi:MAG: hypothetical protein RL251_501, partial [Pseudomonadota bacterium]
AKSITSTSEGEITVHSLAEDAATISLGEGYISLGLGAAGGVDCAKAATLAKATICV